MTVINESLWFATQTLLLVAGVALITLGGICLKLAWLALFDRQKLKELSSDRD